MINVERLIIGVIILMFLSLGIHWYRAATYDWEQCQPSDIKQEKHSGAWIQTIKIDKSTTFIHHPAEDWVEQLYYCPEGEKWRRVN